MSPGLPIAYNGRCPLHAGGRHALSCLPYDVFDADLGERRSRPSSVRPARILCESQRRLLSVYGVSPAKAAINSDRAIAEKLTGAWLPCQESSALQWLAQSNYRSKAEYVLKPQNP